MTRDHLTVANMLRMASRAALLALTLAAPLGFANQAMSAGPTLIEDTTDRGGGVGFVLLVSLQRAG